MNGIIYCIVNKKNEKKYVGQTMVGLKRRYPAKWWKQSGCHNAYLKNSIEKYGIDNFEWEILEIGITSVSELNRLEKLHAEKLNSYIPNGYNIQPCGGNHRMAVETKAKISKTNSKKRIFKDVHGTVYETEQLSQFCKERGLNRQAMLNLFNGFSDYSQGFLRLETDPTSVKMAKVYQFISPSDEIVAGTITEISKKFQIPSWVLAKLVHKQLKTSRGWRLF